MGHEGAAVRQGGGRQVGMRVRMQVYVVHVDARVLRVPPVHASTRGGGERKQ